MFDLIVILIPLFPLAAVLACEDEGALARPISR